MPTWRKSAVMSAGVALAVTGSLYASIPARAQTLPAGCSEIFGGARITCQYLYTGQPQMFVVPPKVTFLLVDLIGATGGRGCGDNDSGGAGGKGAEVQSHIIIPSGTILSVYVGHHGSCGFFEQGGYNGGGPNGFKSSGTSSGGSGGGASDIRSSSSLADRIATAGGGGGGGGGGFPHTQGGAGGDGGATGQTGFPGQVSDTGGFAGGLGGEGAAPDIAGQGGTSPGTCASQPGYPGSAGQGGRGAGNLVEVDGRFSFPDGACGGRGPAAGGLGVGGGGPGGGGGGGVHGGGGGGWGDKPLGGTIYKMAGGGGGGGGGSSYIKPQGSKITSGVATPDGNGRVTITYNTPR